MSTSDGTRMNVPVIDLFAGPGGLGEGFSRNERVCFEVAVSIEKDPMAFETLRLRSAHRKLMESPNSSRAIWARWDGILEDSLWRNVFDTLGNCGVTAIEEACEAAKHEAWHLEMGPANRDEVSKGIRDRLAPFMRGRELPRNAVLIGGPPCQAYSVVGRARNRGTEGYRAEDDHRHFLYREYLNVIREFQPAVFIMENVKGILTSEVSDRKLFYTITQDLKRPDLATGGDVGLEYVLVALPEGSSGLFDPDPEDYVVRAELYGIPQARHRVIICGVRKDVMDAAGSVPKLRRREPLSVGQVINDLPPLRPALSHRGNGLAWNQALELSMMDRALFELRETGDRKRIRVADVMARARARLATRRDPGCGVDRLNVSGSPVEGPHQLRKWYRDRPSTLLANHQSRAHMPEDLVRYLFVSSYGHVNRTSPKLADFPISLLPRHKNIDSDDIESAIFKDRFRVQVAEHFSMTVTSHIAKDGHAFIHPDPLQCRSLTVREAARLQTFPDSYVFLGNRTSQYTQVGNAVPPLLAHQVADLVGQVLLRSGMARMVERHQPGRFLASMQNEPVQRYREGVLAN